MFPRCISSGALLLWLGGMAWAQEGPLKLTLKDAVQMLGEIKAERRAR